MSPSHKKRNRSASSDTPHAGNSISSAAAELSRIHSLAQAPDIPTAADQDLNLSKRHHNRSIDSHTHSHTHHQRRHAARLALSSLLHESGTSGHFGLGLGIHRRNFGLDLDVDGKKNEGGDGGGSSGAQAGTEKLKQIVKEVPRQIASEVPKQIGRYLEEGRRRDEVGVGVGVRTRGTEVGVRVEGGKGWWRGGESAPQAEAAPPPAPPAPKAAPAPEPAPTPQQPLAVDKTTTTLQLAKRYSCHICRFINIEIERCASCGHRLCIDCEWLMPIAKTDGAGQEFAICEDGDAMEALDMKLEDQRRADNVYTPSEFEQENYVDSSPDSPHLAPKVWARQAALAKAHYTTPQSPTAGSPYYTTTQSPTIHSPPPSPVDLSHLSASDYPEPLRLAPSPVRPPGPKSRRVVRDNPFVVADQLSARHRRVMRVDSDAGIRSRDGQASPQPGLYSARDIDLTRRLEERRMWQANRSRDGQPSPQPGRYSARATPLTRRDEERDAQRRIWQTNRVPLPGFGAERESARRASRGEKMPAVERMARPKKLDTVMSEALTPSGSKAGGGGVVEDGGYHARPVPDGSKNGDEKRDDTESSTSKSHGDCKACPCSKEVQNWKGCPLRSAYLNPPHYCGCRLPTQVWNGQMSCQLQTGHGGAPFYLPFGCNPPTHSCPVESCGYARTEQVPVVWAQIPLYGVAGGLGCYEGICGRGAGRNGGCLVVSTGNSCQCHCGKESRRDSAQGGKGDSAIRERL